MQSVAHRDRDRDRDRDNSSLTNVLWLDSLPVGEQRLVRQLDLRKAINVAAGPPVDSTSGGPQPKHLHMLAPDEIRRVKSGLTDNCQRARDRVKQLGEAMTKLEKFQFGVSRKRSRPESGSYERSVSMERAAGGAHVSKGGSGSISNHSTTADAGIVKMGDKMRSNVASPAAPNNTAPNKRMRTSLLSSQRPLPERDRDSSRPSSFLASPVEEKDKSVPTNSDIRDKAKLKGMRSGIKPDASSLTANNGSAEERDLKWNAQQRTGAESRSRLNEGHTFRPPRDENPSPSPTVTTKAKAARAPRSGSSVGANPSSHTARASYPADSRERVTASIGKVQQPTGLSNRKRPAPSRSSSPPVTQWVGQRPQKIARVARRVNGPAGAPAPRDGVSLANEGLAGRDNSLAGTRPSNSLVPASGVPRRTSGPNAQPLTHSKPRSDRVVPSVGGSESDESEEENDKVKEKGRKQGDWEEKSSSGTQKMGNVAMPAKKTRVAPKEETGDGIRRQGRSGRGPSTPRTGVRCTPADKADGSVNAKQLRSARVTVEKADSLVGRPGRPSLKKGAVDRKPITRPRRPPGSNTGDVSGESDDDHEELSKSIRLAANASVSACPNNFWKQLEPYFAFVTPDDLNFLSQQIGEMYDLDSSTPFSTRGDQVGKVNLVVKCVPSVSPIFDSGGKSVGISNGSGANEGGMVKKLLNSFKESNDVCKGSRRASCGIWINKSHSLTQRLLAAFIYEGDIDDATAIQEETCEADPVGSALEVSPFRAGCATESGCIDHDKLEHEVELDGDFGRRDPERWPRRGREGHTIDGNGFSNGYVYSTEGGFSYGNELGESDSILLDVDGDMMPSDSLPEAAIPEEFLRGVGSRSKDGKQEMVRPYGSVGSWKFQCQRMNLDDRLHVELRSIGILCDQGAEISPREDDELCKELEKLQREYNDQICLNKERLHALEIAVAARKEPEERERERLAISKYVEIAYNRRMGSRGGNSSTSTGKGSFVKGARTSALAFAKRTLERIRKHEAGESCLYNAGLWDAVLCVNPRETLSHVSTVRSLESDSPAHLGEVVGVFNGHNQPSAGATMEGVGRLASRVHEGRGRVEGEAYDGYLHSSGPSDDARVKQEPWLTRAKEKEMYLDDVGQPSVAHALSSLGKLNSLGGTKGKRSERDWEGRSQAPNQADGRDMVARGDMVKGARQGISSFKGERKAKPKLRQKIAPLPKGVNGMLAKPHEAFGSLPFTTQQPIGKGMTSLDTLSFPAPNACRVPQDQNMDLSHIPLPGMEDLGVSDLGGQGQDLGSWLDFEDPGLQTSGELMMGLDVPMDDLSDLGMMM